MEGCQRAAVRLLPAGPDDAGSIAPQTDAEAERRADRRGDVRERVPLWNLSAHQGRHQGCSGDGVMSEIVNLSRRRVLKGTLAGGVVLGLHVGGVGVGNAFAAGGASSANSGQAPFAPNAYVSVAPSGEIVLVAHRSEIGTGIRTSLAMILSDELDADWQTGKVLQAQGDAKYGDQNTDGSRRFSQ